MATKIKSFNRPTAIAFGDELEELTQTLAKKYGLLIAVKSRKFSSDTYSARVEVTVIDRDGTYCSY